MSAKQKMTIAITALCLVAVVAVVAVIAVFAASSQTFTSQINVQYTAKHVSGKATANYYINDTEAIKMTTDGNEEVGEETYTLSFDPDKDISGTLQPQTDHPTTLTDANGYYILFEYIFENTSDSADYTAKLTYTGSYDNVKVYTADSASSLASTADQVTTTASTSGENSAVTFSISADVTHGATHYFYVKVMLGDSKANNASFSGAFKWNLEYKAPAPVI